MQRTSAGEWPGQDEGMWPTEAGGAQVTIRAPARHGLGALKSCHILLP